MVEFLPLSNSLSIFIFELDLQILVFANIMCCNVLIDMFAICGFETP